MADTDMAQSASESWLKEFEEAMRLADDILARLNERNMLLASSSDPSRLVSATQRKITVLRTKLDQLESLLQNSPIKSSISEKEMYHRQDMLLGIRYRTKQMFGALINPQPSKRAALMSHDGRSTPPVKSSKTTAPDNYGVINLQKQVTKKKRKKKKQVMRDQDSDLSDLETLSTVTSTKHVDLAAVKEDLAGLEALPTVTSTKHIAVDINEELDLHNRLLDDMDGDADTTDNRLKAVQRKLEVLSSRNSNWSCSPMSMGLMLLAIMLLIVIVLCVAKLMLGHAQ